MAEPPAKKAKAAAQDFTKGWPHPSMLTTPHLLGALRQSTLKGLEMASESLNYGDPANGAYMLGHPEFRKALAGFLQEHYASPVDWRTLMSTAGASMGTDLIVRSYCKPGDLAVVEEPTYFLAHTMLRDRGVGLLGVPIHEDGMDLDALEAHLTANPGKIKMVYTVAIHQNPTGYCMSDAKRARLVALAKTHKFYICSDEAYQLLSFEPTPFKPLYYHDDPADPRVFSVGTFSKLIGPGIKIGWIQAHADLIKPLPNVGFIDSGNNPVIFSSCQLIDFIKSGNLAIHIQTVCKAMGERCSVMCKKLREEGFEVHEPKGGYFVWIKSKGKMTGRSGEPMAINRDKFHDWMRLCFAWLEEEKMIEGIEYLRP